MEKWELLLCFSLGCVIRGLPLPRALHGEGEREKDMKALGGVGGKAELSGNASWGSD